MRTILSFLVAVSSFFTAAAFAQTEIPHGDFSELRLEGTSKVQTVIDPLTILLKNGKTIRLTGLDLPDFDPFEPGEMAARAKDLLKAKYEEKDITIYNTKDSKNGRVNRMGHELAHIELADEKLWAQGLLLSEGLARVRTSKRNPEMAAQMYALEHKAREEEKGIWGLAGFPVLNTQTAESSIGAFQVVEGTVHGVASVRNTIYLNFGPDWKTDFTIGIKAGDRRLFIKEGLDPMSWGGKTLRARGWLRSYNGPYMEIDHPQAIEIIE
jgi:endonuclease YncB( thermonuclease family)